MNKIRVMIVDDSMIARELLEYIINSDSRLEVVAQAVSAEEAIQMVPKIKPDVLTVDIHLPNMNGYELTRKIMSSIPIPIVIISGLSSAQSIESCFKAMELGALSLLSKPSGVKSEHFAKDSAEIVRQIKIAAEVKLVTRKPDQKVAQQSYQAVALGGSLGGPQALNQIFSELPSAFPVPLYVVQHISPGFINGMITWFQKSSKLKVVLAEDGQKSVPGNIYIAPDRADMIVKRGGIIELVKQSAQPSVNSLFSSISDTYGNSGVGIILTGMGRDGAKGLLKMKEKGAHTIAQDFESSTIFGMPLEAIRIGAAKQVLSIDKIAPKLVSLVCKGEVYE